MPTISMFYGIIIRMYRELGGKHHMPHPKKTATINNSLDINTPRRIGS